MSVDYRDLYAALEVVFASMLFCPNDGNNSELMLAFALVDLWKSSKLLLEILIFPDNLRSANPVYRAPALAQL